MTTEQVAIAFQIIVFLFAISVHESAHAWMAWRLGDPTARMLGRVSLNPIRHIDPIGTVLLPALMLLTGVPFLFGWAKPTPVNPLNFKNQIRDDILTSVAGPVSNFIMATASIIGLRLLWTYGGHATVSEPLSVLLLMSMAINVLLGVFNLIPVPPLDGSHVLRHLLPAGARSVYDRVGILGLVLLFVVGGSIISYFSAIVQNFLVNTFLRGI